MHEVNFVVVMLGIRLLFEIVVYGEDSIPDHTEGYWGEKTANTNWCERDYVVTPYIAEFGNSLSSLFVVWFGLYGLYIFTLLNVWWWCQ